jgi:MFS family permease
MQRTSTPDLLSAVRARWGTSAVFFGNGLVFASWVLHVPTVRDALRLEPGVLGLALLGIAAGSLVSMPVAGALITRFGSRAVTRPMALLNPLTLVLPLLAPDLLTLVLALVVYGAVTGALDVAMNAQGVAVERRLARPVLSSFHAWFSFGALVGAALGAPLLGAGVTPLTHVSLVALVFAAVMLIAGTVLLPREADGVDQGADTAAPGQIWRPTPVVLLLGALGFIGLMGEGAIADWSAVYSRDLLNADVATAGLAYGAFSLAMTIGRVFGDTWRGRFGDARLVGWGATLAALGLAAALAAPTAWLAAPGFAAFGLGVANIVPVLFAAAGRSADAGRAIAQVSTLGYFGFLAGPPLLGLVAQVSGLRLALALVAVLTFGIAILARLNHRLLRDDATKNVRDAPT